MKTIEYEATSWRIIVPSSEGYDLAEVRRLFAEQGVRPGLVNTIKRHPIGYVADDRRQVRWNEEIQDGIKTMVIDLHRRLRKSRPR